MRAAGSAWRRRTGRIRTQTPSSDGWIGPWRWAGREQAMLQQLECGALGREAESRIDLPETICFRVTRYCNARCGFCLAPPDGSHPDADTLIGRLDWAIARGVRTI